MNPTILLVRHGETPLNDPKNEAIRGYSDIPLSVEGKRGVEEAAEFLRAMDYPIQRVLSSPLQRAMMTAMVVADPRHAKVIPENSLLPWNLGDLSGKPIKDVAPLMDWLQDHPDIKAPRGESYCDFYYRWAAGLDRMLYYATVHEDEILVGVVHSRNLLALPSVLGDRNIGDVPVKGGPPPESITKLENIDGEWTMSLLWEED
jgi:broad specificity phosphatase PhoE